MTESAHAAEGESSSGIAASAESPAELDAMRVVSGAPALFVSGQDSLGRLFGL